MPNEFRFKPARIEEMVYTLEATLTIGQWRKVLETIDRADPRASVAWDLRTEISQLIRQAGKEFQTSLEEFDGRESGAPNEAPEHFQPRITR
jgi:hypothetical protein